MKQAWFSLWLFLFPLAVGCTPSLPATAPASPTALPVSTATPTLGIAPSRTLAPTATQTLTPQPRLGQVRYGPDRENFPPGVNPLSGKPQATAEMLELPAVLVSISNMPASARPQAGLAFAPWVFELFIGTGTTRFMGVFYGDLPRRIPNVVGACQAAAGEVDSSLPWVGNRVWLDENVNGLEDAWEAGIGQVCVSLLDGESGQPVAITATDSNGYFGLSISPGKSYRLGVQLPAGYQFTHPDLSNDDQDSDINPQTSESAPFIASNVVDASRDAGLILTQPPAPTATATPGGTPAVDIAPNRTYVGPVRSGRLTYNDFYRMFPFSCPAFAGAGEGILERLEVCELVFGTSKDSPNTALLDTSRMLELARQNKSPKYPVNYSGNLFDDDVPPDGQEANQVLAFYHRFTQARWTYQPISGLYLRETDDADGLGVFHPHLDRLTGRQLAFENLIFIQADYQIFRHLQYDVDFRIGLEGYATLFRDGKRYKIRWSTANREWEKQTGFLRPLHFIGVDKQPFPLKPGRVWISILTLNSVVEDLGNGGWRAFFLPPNDPPTK